MSKWSQHIAFQTYDKIRCEDVYSMEEIIGEGTSSDVVKATHNVLHNQVAIKIIDKNRIQTEKQRQRLVDEIAIHKKVSSHPHIVRFIEVYESEIDICLVMELCEGGELFNRIVEKGCFSEKEAGRTIRQIVSAVQYLHSMGIVHRDIKPENLLYTSKDENAEAKLADFGLAKQLPDHHDGRGMLKASLSGTTAYCAPERLNQIQESKAVDMWSIGCILYFMLFGVPPFYSNKEDEEEHDDEIFDSVLNNTINFPEGKNVSMMAKDLILRLLEKDPGRRITADQVLVHPFIMSHTLSQQPVVDNSQFDLNSKNSLKSSINKMIDMAEKQDPLD
eukprot:CAMPEP_0168552150 /NCGR_PEP_ID=MMETSP0413-20121227/6561_1 /TAXON_ID=136452 /ORGANISM="Filamoeba nolandi, Strain NC-AS-23-1" /LENGTH=332 /DNA_ID=CAMNT_0008582741 /DNA_START=115 /DNA_END=1113 /DNA_ORIENTATION=+